MIKPFALASSLLVFGIAAQAASSPDPFPASDATEWAYECDQGASVSYISDLGAGPALKITWKGQVYSNLEAVSFDGSSGWFTLDAQGHPVSPAFQVVANGTGKELIVDAQPIYAGTVLDRLSCRAVTAAQDIYSAILKGDLSAFQTVNAAHPWYKYYPAALAEAIYQNQLPIAKAMLAVDPAAIDRSVTAYASTGDACISGPELIAVGAGNAELLDFILRANSYEPAGSLMSETIRAGTLCHDYLQDAIRGVAHSVVEEVLYRLDVPMLKVLLTHGLFKALPLGSGVYDWAFCGSLQEKKSASEVIQTVLAGGGPSPLPWGGTDTECDFAQGTVQPLLLEVTLGSGMMNGLSPIAFGAFTRDLDGLKAMVAGIPPAQLVSWQKVQGSSDGPGQALMAAALVADTPVLDYVRSLVGPKASLSADLLETTQFRVRDMIQLWNACLAGQYYGAEALPDSYIGAACPKADYAKLVAGLLAYFPNTLFDQAKGFVGAGAIFRALDQAGLPLDGQYQATSNLFVETGMPDGVGSALHGSALASLYAVGRTDYGPGFVSLDGHGWLDSVHFLMRRYPKLDLNGAMSSGTFPNELQGATPIEALISSLQVIADLRSDLVTAQVGPELAYVLHDLASAEPTFDRTRKNAQGKTAYDLCETLAGKATLPTVDCSVIRP